MNCKPKMEQLNKLEWKQIRKYKRLWTVLIKFDNLIERRQWQTTKQATNLESGSIRKVKQAVIITKNPAKRRYVPSVSLFIKILVWEWQNPYHHLWYFYCTSIHQTNFQNSHRYYVSFQWMASSVAGRGVYDVFFRWVVGHTNWWRHC